MYIQSRPNCVCEFCVVDILTFLKWCGTYILVGINNLTISRYVNIIKPNVLHLNKKNEFFYYVAEHCYNTYVLVLDIINVGSSTLLAVVPSPDLVTVAEFCDLARVSEWCDLYEMKLNSSKTKTMIVSRSCTQHYTYPVTPINYWWNCAEGVWWPWYIGSDIWFQDDLSEASLLVSWGPIFSKTWYL